MTDFGEEFDQALVLAGRYVEPDRREWARIAAAGNFFEVVFGPSPEAMSHTAKAHKLWLWFNRNGLHPDDVNDENCFRCSEGWDCDYDHTNQLGAELYDHEAQAARAVTEHARLQEKAREGLEALLPRAVEMLRTLPDDVLDAWLERLKLPALQVLHEALSN